MAQSTLESQVAARLPQRSMAHLAIEDERKKNSDDPAVDGDANHPNHRSHEQPHDE